MILIPRKDALKEERKAIYFDLSCGIVSSILSLIGITFVGLTAEIKYPNLYILGLIFWIGYLIFSFFMIGLGIYLWYKEKKYGTVLSKKKKKDLKPPIVS